MGNTLQPLYAEGRTLKDKSGRVIVCFSDKLCTDEVALYAQTLSTAPDMLNLIESIVSDAVNEYENAYKNALEYNNRADVPSLRPLNSYPPFPEWVQKGLSIIAKAKGQKPE